MAIVPLVGWTVLIADFNPVWTDDEVVRDLSAGGESPFHSWATGALHVLHVARDGEIVRAFDPWHPDDHPVGEPGALRLPQLSPGRSTRGGP